MVLVCRLFTKDFLYPLISVFTALLVAPRFREQLKSASVYEFLETRWGLACRLFGAATYVVSQLLKLCTTLYLMSVPISMLVGLPLPLVIVFTGVFVTAYSMSGGMSAVVYTDVLQVDQAPPTATVTFMLACMHALALQVRLSDMHSMHQHTTWTLCSTDHTDYQKGPQHLLS